MLISDIVKEILETNNLSQEKLAKILKVSQKSISNWLRGVDMPKSRSILSFYEKFGITPNELMGLEEPKSFKRRIIKKSRLMFSTEILKPPFYRV